MNSTNELYFVMIKIFLLLDKFVRYNHITPVFHIVKIIEKVSKWPQFCVLRLVRNFENHVKWLKGFFDEFFLNGSVIGFCLVIV